MIKRIAVALALLLSLTACEPAKGKGGDHPRIPPPKAGQQNPAPHGQQPAPVQGDPSAHNLQPGEVDLHVNWSSERSGETPACEWTKNGGPAQPCAGIRPGVQEDPGEPYFGLWEYTTTGKAGDRFIIAAQGALGVTDISCEVWWKGAYHGGVSNKRRCSIDYTLS